MAEITLALILLALALFFHIVWWRIRVPRRQTKALLGIFIATLFFASACTYLSGDFNLTTYGSIAIPLFFISAMLAYTITYSAIEVDSPSLLIIQIIAKSPGITGPELLRQLDNDFLLRPRISDLLRDGHIKNENGLLTLSSKGRRFISVFILFRSLLRAEKGG